MQCNAVTILDSFELLSVTKVEKTTYFEKGFMLWAWSVEEKWNRLLILINHQTLSITWNMVIFVSYSTVMTYSKFISSIKAVAFLMVYSGIYGSWGIVLYRLESWILDLFILEVLMLVLWSLIFAFILFLWICEPEFAITTSLLMLLLAHLLIDIILHSINTT